MNMSMRRIASLLLAVLIGAAVLGGAAPAGAVDNPNYTAPPPTTPVTSPQPARQVETAVTAAPVRTRLAITGSDATGLALLGGSLLLGGAAVLALRRRSLSAAS
jgi:LPXTG-motif cell wall-anchored protein